jgi:hypothetical protein
MGVVPPSIYMDGLSLLPTIQHEFFTQILPEKEQENPQFMPQSYSRKRYGWIHIGIYETP